MTKKILLSLLTLFLSTFSYSQWTYNSSYTVDGGNPGGSNNEADNTGLAAWTTIMTGPQSVNIWSPAVTLPFSFNFYGNSVTQFKASQNGLVTFDVASALLPNANTSLPTALLPNNTICGFWDEFTSSPPTGTGDNLAYTTFGFAPYRQLWITWYSFEMGNPANSFGYFSVVLEESTNNIYIVDKYSSGSALTSTVGVHLNSSIGMDVGNSIAFSSGSTAANSNNDYYTFSPQLLVADNAGVTALNSPTLPLTTGLQNVEVTVQNLGVNALNSFTVNWQINGITQTPFPYTTPSLAVGATTPPLNIGSYIFPSGFTTLKFWTSLPNGNPDGNPLDDTLEVSACTALTGVYSVGGVSPDFATITQAISGLTTCGISGPVTFNIAPGTYNEFATLPAINGSSAINTITFNGGSSATTSIVNNGLSQMATIGFIGADYVTWKNLTINSTNALDAWGVQMTNASDHNTIDSCIIVMDQNATEDVIGIVISDSPTDDFAEGFGGNYNTYSNIDISGGEMGIHLEGGASNGAWIYGNQFININIHNVEDYGIYLDNVDTFTMIGCKIYDINNSNGDGFWATDIANYTISRNEIYAPDYCFYVFDGNFDFSVLVRSTITNNFFKSNSDYGMYLDDFEKTNILHNTVVGNPAIRINDIDRVDIRNNIFYSESDFAFESDDDITIYPTLDYNLYWTPSTNSNFADIGVNVYSNLASWQIGAPTINGGSIEVEPTFVSPTDLHRVGIAGNDLGDNSANVTIDIDGQARPQSPSTIVDMGADEYTPPGDDAGLTLMTSPILPLSAGLQNVIVAVKNFGTNSLSSFTVNWEINGVAQTPFAYTSPAIPSNGTSAPLTIGTYNFLTGSSTMKFWTSSPNSAPDADPLNDTLFISTCTGISGNFTIGGTTPDYPTLNSAVSDMINCGITGPVYFEVAPGVYYEYLTLPKINGTSSTNTVIFNGGSSGTTTIESNGIAQYAVIGFTGADYVTFKNFTIKNTINEDGWGVHLSDTSDYNIIDSCIIEMDPAGTQDVIGIVLSASPSDDYLEGNSGNHNIFSNNYISGGEMGIHIEGPVAVGEWIVGNKFLNNIIYGMDDYGIYMDNIDSITVVGNKIYGNRAAGGDGLYCQDIANFNFSENEIYAPDYGMYIADGNFDFVVSGQSLVINNIVRSETDYGIYFDDIENVNIYHNTVVGEPAIRINDFVNLNIRNNIFKSETDFAFESDDDILTNVLDYNMYYTPLSNLNFASVGTNIFYDLLNWQFSIPANNASSIEMEPTFISSSNLRRIGQAGNDLGDNSVGILVDIDGDTRPELPSIVVDFGADEYTPLGNDIAVLGLYADNWGCGDSLSPISVIVQNLGYYIVGSFPITAEVTADITTTMNTIYSGTLAFGEIDTVLLGTINTYSGGIISVSTWTSLFLEENPSNDSLLNVSLGYIPFEPIGINGNGCGVDSALLEVSNQYPATYNWFDAPVGGSIVSSNHSFMVPSIATQNTYYLEYSQTLDSLTTTYAAGTGCAGGSMVNVQAFTGSIISGLKINGSSAPGTIVPVSVYYRIGGYVGFQTNPSAWTSAGSYDVISNGVGAPSSLLTLNNAIVLPEGVIVGVYIKYDGDYTSGANVYSTGSATVTTGAGLCGAFSGVNNNRSFNGTFYFGSNACSSFRTAVTANQTAPITTNLGADTTVCGPSITLNAGNPTASFTWSNGATGQTNVIDTAGIYWVEVIDTNGCVAKDTVDLFINPLNVSLPATAFACTGDSVLLTPIVIDYYGYTFGWSNANPTLVSTVSTSGTYTIDITDTLGCSSSASTIVTVESAPVANYTNTLTSGVVLNLTSSASASDSTVYNFGDGSASVSSVNATHTYTVNGTYTVCQYVYNDCGSDSMCTSIVINSVGLDELSLNNIELYPNPTSDLLTVKMGQIDMNQLEIVTAEGKIVSSYGITNQVMQINVSSLESGIYFVRLRGDIGIQQKRFIKN